MSFIKSLEVGALEQKISSYPDGNHGPAPELSSEIPVATIIAFRRPWFNNAISSIMPLIIDKHSVIDKNLVINKPLVIDKPLMVFEKILKFLEDKTFRAENQRWTMLFQHWLLWDSTNPELINAAFLQNNAQQRSF